MQKWIAFQFCLEGSCAFLFKSLRFILDLNIHVFGSQLLREVFELLMSDRGLQPSVHTYSWKSCIMLGIKHAISFLEGQRRDVSLRLLKFSDFDLSSSQ